MKKFYPEDPRFLSEENQFPAGAYYQDWPDQFGARDAVHFLKSGQHP